MISIDLQHNYHYYYWKIFHVLTNIVIPRNPSPYIQQPTKNESHKRSPFNLQSGKKGDGTLSSNLPLSLPSLLNAHAF